jgi:hypothetical protein
MSAFVRARVWLTRRLCRCDEIECSRCTLPWLPIEERSKRELIEDYRELDAHNAELMRRLKAVRAATFGLARTNGDDS